MNLWVALAVSLALHSVVLFLLGAPQKPTRLGTISIALYGGAGEGGLEGPGEGTNIGVGKGEASVREEDYVEDPLEPAVSERREPLPVARKTTPSPRPRSQPEKAEPAETRSRVSTAKAAPRVDDRSQRASHSPSEIPRENAEPPVDGRGVATGGGLGTGEGDVGQAVAGGAGGGSGTGGGGGDLQASCVACPVPRYPRRARRRGWEGVVDLRLRIDGTGRVSAVTVARSSGFGVLDDAASAAARRSRFQLRSREEMSSAVWGRMRYRFELSGG
jgi:protein TonB